MEKEIRNILVLRKHNHVGDMLCSLPLYAALKKRWPEARITLLANPTRYPIPLLKLNPYLDEVVLYEKGSIGRVLRSHVTLRRRQFDAAFVPSTVALSRTSHITAFLSGASLRVGVRSIDGVENPSHRLLNVKRDVQWVGQKMHQMQRNLQIAESAGCALSRAEMLALRIPVEDAAQRRADAWLRGLDGEGPVIGMHPGAGKPQNLWPADRFGETAVLLHRRHHCSVVVTAGALDVKEVQALTARLQREGVPHRVLENADIPMLAAVMRRMHLYLTNDTGTMHIAAFSGCPTVSLFGPTFAWEWAPLGHQHGTVVSPDGEIESITVEEVHDVCTAAIAAG